jgi:hypothetical protein
LNTLIKIGEIGIEIATCKKNVLLSIQSFLKNKAFYNGTLDNSLGFFNGFSQLTSKLIQYLENLEDTKEYPATIFIVNIDNKKYHKEQIISITKGIKNSLTKEEIEKIKNEELEFDIFGRIHNSYQIKIDAKSTISNLETFKTIIEKRFKNYSKKHERKEQI